jgi:hypothetical protein
MAGRIDRLRSLLLAASASIEIRLDIKRVVRWKKV